MKKLFSFPHRASLPTMLGVAVGVFAVVALVQAATTISTNIQTDGTLSVTGLSSLTTASTSGAVSLAGNLWVGGNATTSSNGNIATQGTLTVTGVSTHTGNTILSTASTTGLATVDSLKVSSVGSTVSGVLFGTCTVTPGAIAASSTVVATCAATGVTTSYKVFVTPYITNNGIFMVSASSTANDIIQVAVHNVGYTGAVTPAANVWSWMAVR